MKKSLLLLAFFSMGLVAYGGVKVTFSVDMSIYQKNGYFNPVSDSVTVAGNFNNWSTTANLMTQGTGADTAIYSVQVDTAGSIAYKFTFYHLGTLNWESVNNRTASIGANDTTLPTVKFNDITGAPEHVWFKVDMTLPLKSGAIVAADTVGVTGDFTGWGTTGTGFLRLTKDANDSVYAGLADSLASGRTVNFKYIYILNGSATWENTATGNNRTVLCAPAGFFCVHSVLERSESKRYARHREHQLQLRHGRYDGDRNFQSGRRQRSCQRRV